MVWMNTNKRYGVVSQILHVLVAFLVVVQLSAGFWFMNTPSEMKHVVYAEHKISGLFILFLMLIRLSWRMGNVLVDMPEGTTELQGTIARSVHRLLYTLLIIMPLSGWAMATLSGYPPVVPGIGAFSFPLLKRQAVCVFGTPYRLVKIMAWTHFYTGCLLALLIAWHAFIGISGGQKTLNRMFSNKD